MTVDDVGTGFCKMDDLFQEIFIKVLSNMSCQNTSYFVPASFKITEVLLRFPEI